MKHLMTALLAATLCLASVSHAPAQSAAPAGSDSGSATVTRNGPAPEAGSNTGFLVRPGDVLRIRVWPDSALGGDFPVEETGLVYLPVIGPLQAGGVPLEEIRARLRSEYGEAMKVPVVTVTPIFRVGVLGGVVRPGLYVVDPTHTVLDVVSLAGGFNDRARDDGLYIVRDGARIEVGDVGEAAYGLAASRERLQSGDYVVVPQRRRWLTAQTVYIGLQSIISVVTLISVLN